MKINKKILTFAVFGLFAIAMVSAGLVSHYLNKDFNISGNSPIVQYGEESENLNWTFGSGYKLLLVEGENLLNSSVPTNARFVLLDGEGNEVTDTTGFHLAYSEDIQYAYSEDYGNAQNWEEAETWMSNNLDWFDWYANDDYSEYNDSVITNHNGDSFYQAIDFNTNIPVELSPGKFYAVIYLDVEPSVIPDDYKFSVEIMPN